MKSCTAPLIACINIDVGRFIWPSLLLCQVLNKSSDGLPLRNCLQMDLIVKWDVILLMVSNSDDAWEASACRLVCIRFTSFR